MVGRLRQFTPGGVWDGTTIPLTGIIEFDFFFTLMMVSALVGVVIIMAIRVMTRS